MKRFITTREGKNVIPLHLTGAVVDYLAYKLNGVSISKHWSLTADLVPLTASANCPKRIKKDELWCYQKYQTVILARYAANMENAR